MANLIPIPDVDMTQSLMPDQGTNLSIRIDPSWGDHKTKDWLVATNQDKPYLNVTFFDLENGIEETCQPSYATTDALGRAEMYKTYSGTSNRQVQLLFNFRAQGLSGGSGSEYASQNEVVGPARFLESLKFPFVDFSGISHAPPPVVLTIGMLLTMRCILEDATIRWVGPWENGTYSPHGADVSCTFTAVTKSFSNYSAFGANRFQPAFAAVAPPPLSTPSVSSPSRGSLLAKPKG